MNEQPQTAGSAVDYFAVIHRFISPDSHLYRIYIPHVTCVTHKALSTADRLGLTAEQKQFIEEAAMLHDIGVVRVDAPDLGCHGNLPYPAHVVAGGEMLRSVGLPRHARVAERHIGVGIEAGEIELKELALPTRDFVSETLEEQVISWADLFFGKNPKRLWVERSIEEVRSKVAKWGDRDVRTFETWLARFNV
jgi:uncharacterized protein